MRAIFRKITYVALGNVNYVSYATRMNHESHFSWQRHNIYNMVMLEGNPCSFTHCKERFICDEDRS